AASPATAPDSKRATAARRPTGIRSASQARGARPARTASRPTRVRAIHAAVRPATPSASGHAVLAALPCIPVNPRVSRRARRAPGTTLAVRAGGRGGPGPAPPRRERDRTDEWHRDPSRRGLGQLRARRGREQPRDGQLPFDADVEESRTEGDIDRRAGEQQRGRLVDDLARAVRSPPGPRDELLRDVARRLAVDPDDDRQREPSRGEARDRTGDAVDGGDPSLTPHGRAPPGRLAASLRQSAPRARPAGDRR